MMAQKHLRDLLMEDQEPFFLDNYIEERRFQLKRLPTVVSHLQVKKPKAISHHPNSKSLSSNICKSICFLSYQASPDPRKSPLSDFSAPARNPNSILLHVPSKTAALLLEAALRIHKSSSSAKYAPRKKPSARTGIFNSILKRLTRRHRAQKREIGGSRADETCKKMVATSESGSGADSLDSNARRVWSFSGECAVNVSSNTSSRRSSTVSSESRGDESLVDLETSSSSSHCSEAHDIVFVSEDGVVSEFTIFYGSPSRPSVQKCRSPGARTPKFASPASSPTRHMKESDDKNCDAERLQRCEVDEEEKEQSSPVSVLEPPFQDDDESHECEDADEGEDENEEEDGGGFDYECSYAIVQRTKKQLLYKLRRFEKLAELDPIELEKRMLELDEGEDDYDNDVETEEIWDCQASPHNKATGVDDLVRKVISLSFASLRKVPSGLTKLVSELVTEEEGKVIRFVEEEVVKSVCKRIESWKDVDSLTIDMMLEEDFKRELDGWKMNQEELGEMAVDIELAICGFLLDELSQELAFGQIF